MIPDPRDPMFGPEPLPEWVKEFRPQQWDAIEQIVEAFNHSKVVFLQAPTGAGKSLIAETVRRLTRSQAIYTCTTKVLQDQLAHDFPYAKVIKGKSNYLTYSGKMDRFGNPAPHLDYSAITANDCTHSNRGECRWCPTRTLCPYQVAKGEAGYSPFAILNTAFLFSSLAGRDPRNPFAGRDLAVMDEADKLEDQLLNFVEVSISARAMDRMRLDPPKRKTVEAAWFDWVSDVALPGVRGYLNSLTKPEAYAATIDDVKEFNKTERLVERLVNLQIDLPNSKWVYDGYDKGDCIFRPVKVSSHGRQIMWPNAKKFLLMSATILSADHMADELGYIDPPVLIDLPSEFPVENRKIYVAPVADMSYKNRDNAWPDMAKGVAGVLRRHPTDRILVHTVSFALAAHLSDSLTDTGHPVFTYRNTQERTAALHRFKNTPGAVLLAPSMDRGVDLPGDLCRVQIICKIPFPHIKDKRISVRLKSSGGSTWYKMQAIRTLVQMCGRAVRSADDHAVTYILDRQFIDNLGKSKHLFPKWWAEGLDYTFNPRRLMKDECS